MRGHLTLISVCILKNKKISDVNPNEIRREEEMKIVDQKVCLFGERHPPTNLRIQQRIEYVKQQVTIITHLFSPFVRSFFSISRERRYNLRTTREGKKLFVYIQGEYNEIRNDYNLWVDKQYFTPSLSAFQTTKKIHAGMICSFLGDMETAFTMISE